MWYRSEFSALQKLLDTKFDSNLEDVLYKEEIEAIKKNGQIAWENLKNQIVIPPHQNEVWPISHVIFSK